jgi:hypothetical protein
MPALVLVEDQFLNHGAHGRARDTGNERQRANGCGGQRVESGLVRFRMHSLPFAGTSSLSPRSRSQSGGARGSCLLSQL